MFCNNCGQTVENGSAFCTNCGVRLEVVPAAPEVQMAAQPTVPEAPASAMPLPVENSGIYEPQAGIMPPPTVMPDNANAKVDFGKGALAFCLVIIGLLAISTGVFAGLYFSMI